MLPKVLDDLGLISRAHLVERKSPLHVSAVIHMQPLERKHTHPHVQNKHNYSFTLLAWSEDRRPNDF